MSVSDSWSSLHFCISQGNPLQGRPCPGSQMFLAGPPEDEMWVTPLQAYCEQCAGLSLTPVCRMWVAHAVLIRAHAILPHEHTCVQDVGGALAGFVKRPFLHDVALHQFQGARQGLTQLAEESILPAAVCQVDIL